MKKISTAAAQEIVYTARADGVRTCTQRKVEVCTHLHRNTLSPPRV